MGLPTNDRGGGLVTNDRGNGAIEIQSGGTTVGGSLCLNFSGAGVTATINPATGCADIVIPGGGGGGATRQTVYDAQGIVPVVQLTDAILDTTAALSWTMIAGPGTWIKASGPSKLLTIGAADPGTGAIGSNFPQPIEVNTEFGDTFRLGYDQPVSGKAGLFALNSDTFLLSHKTPGQPIQVSTSTVTGAPLESGAISWTTGSASGGSTTSGGYTWTVGQASDAVGGFRWLYGAGVGGALPTVAPTVAQWDQPTGYTDQEPHHRFERADPGGARVAELFIGEVDPDGTITAEAGSLFLADTLAGSNAGELWVNTTGGGVPGTDWKRAGLVGLDDGDAATVGGILQWGNGATGGTTAARYLTPGFDGTAAPLLGARQAMVVPRTGTLVGLYVHQNGAGSSMATVDYEVILGFNGGPPVITGIQASIAANVVGTASDTVNTHPVVAGDLIWIQYSKQAAGGSGPSDVVATLEVR